MLHQVGVSFDLYYDARKHKIKIYRFIILIQFAFIMDRMIEYRNYPTSDGIKKKILDIDTRWTW